MKTYEEYKDSGIEWIGEIPEHWECTSLSHVVSNITDGSHHSPPTIENGYPYITVSDITNNTIDFENCKHISYSDYLDLVKNGCQPNIGDILITKDGTIGKAIVIKEEKQFVILSSLGLLTPNKKIINDDYLRYFLISGINIDQMFSWIRGSALTRLTIKLIKNLLVTFSTNLDEQKQIASYLDHKTSLIDKLLEKNEKLISLLEEQRSAIINQAVTKGLNPNVKMKDSGIEWIGEIPEHWGVSKLRYITRSIGDGLHSTPNYNDEADYYFINGNNLINGVIKIQPSTKTVNKSEYQKHYINMDDMTLLLSINGTIGNLAIYDNEPVILGKSCCYINLKNNQKRRFFLYCLSSWSISKYYGKEVTGTTIFNLSLRSVGNTPVTIVPLEEQESIVDYLDHKSSQIDKLVEEKSKTIEYLKEYRTALISNVVTGKIDVRDEVIPQSFN